MNNPNKHKPLSPEELFKLLDNKSNKASDFDELDDFEKEALEGFAAHVDSEKAQALTDELNLAISQKASGVELKESKKNKLIWFSAAASIVMIIMISVFFFNQSKEESQTNIALNELKEDRAPVISPAGTVPPLETVSENMTTTNATQEAEDRGKQLAKLLQTEGPKKESGESMAGLTNEPALGYSESKPTLSPGIMGSKDEAKRREDDQDALQKQAEVVADKMNVKEKPKSANLEQEIAAGDITLSASQVASNTNVDRVTTMDEKTLNEESTYKADRNKSVSAKKIADKQSKAKEQSTTPDAESANAVVYTKSPSAPAQGSASDGNLNTTHTASGKRSNNSAYYIGSELAIRDVVLNYFKDRSLTTPIGKYKIKGIVDAKGKLKVSSVTKISQEDCKCSAQLENALNSMKNWNSANQEGKDVSSDVEFTLAF
ncbi:MAG: hypothetical protein V4677_05200 [Bacteroidota bacterium]